MVYSFILGQQIYRESKEEIAYFMNSSEFDVFKWRNGFSEISIKCDEIRSKTKGFLRTFQMMSVFALEIPFRDWRISFILSSKIVAHLFCLMFPCIVLKIYFQNSEKNITKEESFRVTFCFFFHTDEEVLGYRIHIFHGDVMSKFYV